MVMNKKFNSAQPTSSGGGCSGSGTFYDSIPRSRYVDSNFKDLQLPCRGSQSEFFMTMPFSPTYSQTGQNTIFPKLQDCAHFHYDYVEIGSIHFSLFRNTPNPPQSVHEDPLGMRLFDILVVCGGKSWVLHRNLAHFFQLDQHLHTCIFDRRYSGLSEIQRIMGTNERDCDDKLTNFLASYLQRLSNIAADNIINCAPVLNWFEMDNKGHHLVALSECSDLNTPAITAAFAVKRYAAKSSQELSFEVGDIISIIDMGSPFVINPQSDQNFPPKSWWKGKRGFNVGYFPSQHVELLNENCLGSEQATIQRRSNASEISHPRCSSLLERSTTSLGILPTNLKWINFLQTFFNSRPSKRKLRARGIYKERVFGCDLGEYLSNINQQVPPMLSLCCEWIEKYGIVDGIYRLSGISSSIQKIRNAFDDEKIPDLDVIQDIHSISSALKMYFRELPNPLLTYQLYSSFVEAISQQTSDNGCDIGDDVIVERLIDVTRRLPPPHYRTLVHLFGHLSFMAKHSDLTNMHPKNLAIVWAPNLLRCREVNLELTADSAATALHGASVQALVTEYLIKYAHRIFSPLPAKTLSLAHEGGRDVTMRQSVKRSNGYSSVISQPYYGSNQGNVLGVQSFQPRRPKSMGVASLKSLQFYPQVSRTSTETITTNCYPSGPPQIEVKSPNVISNSGGDCVKTLEYMDICGGPSALPSQYHTVIELPGQQGTLKQQGGRKKKKRIALKELQTSLHQCLPQDQSPTCTQYNTDDHSTWLPLRPRNQIILSEKSEVSTCGKGFAPNTEPLNEDWQGRLMSTSVVKLWDLPLSADTIIDMKYAFNVMATSQQPDNFIKRNVMKHWRHKSDDSEAMVRRFRSNAIAPLAVETVVGSQSTTSPPRQAPNFMGKLDGISEVCEESLLGYSRQSPSSPPREGGAATFSFHTRFPSHHKGTNTENLSFPRIGKLLKNSPKRAALFPRNPLSSVSSEGIISSHHANNEDRAFIGTAFVHPESDARYFGSGRFGADWPSNSTPTSHFNFYENVPNVMHHREELIYSDVLTMMHSEVPSTIDRNTETQLEADSWDKQQRPSTVTLVDTSSQTEDNQASAPLDPSHTYAVIIRSKQRCNGKVRSRTSLLRRANSDTLFPLNPLPKLTSMETTAPHLPSRQCEESVENTTLDQNLASDKALLEPPADYCTTSFPANEHMGCDPTPYQRIEREINITLQSFTSRCQNLNDKSLINTDDTRGTLAGVKAEFSPPRPPSPQLERGISYIDDFPIHYPAKNLSGDSLTIANAALDNALTVLHKHRRYSDRQMSPDIHDPSSYLKTRPNPSAASFSNSYVNSLPRRRRGGASRMRPTLIASQPYEALKFESPLIQQSTCKFIPQSFKEDECKYDAKPEPATSRSSPAVVLNHVAKFGGNEVKLHKPTGILKHGATSPRLSNAENTIPTYGQDHGPYPPIYSKPPIKRRVGFAIVTSQENSEPTPQPPSNYGLEQSLRYNNISTGKNLMAITKSHRDDPGPTPINVRMLKDRFENHGPQNESVTLRKATPERCVVFRRLISSDCNAPSPPARNCLVDPRSPNSLSPLKGTRNYYVGKPIV